jgi:hypothetical protein
LQNRFAILHAAKTPIRGLFTIYQARENPSVDFFRDQRFAQQISELLSRPSVGFLPFIKHEKIHPWTLYFLSSTNKVARSTKIV